MTTEQKKSKQALEGRRLNAFGRDPNTLTIIGLDTDDGEDHPLYDERIKLPLDEALVKNIMVEGVLQPILVRKDGDRVLVVAGRQRVRATREANKRLAAKGCVEHEVPCLVRKGQDASMIGVMISENELRRDDGFASKLAKLERYMATGKDEEAAATAFGVSTATIKNWLLVLEAGPEVRKAMDKGLLGATAAAKIAALPRAQQAEAVKEATANGPVTAQTAERVARSKRQSAATGKEERTIVPPSKRILRKLAEGTEFQQLDVDAIQVLRWVLGEIPAERVKGLTAILRKLDGDKGKEAAE